MHITSRWSELHLSLKSINMYEKPELFFKNNTFPQLQLTSMTHSNWIFCISLASCVARSGCRRKWQCNTSDKNVATSVWPRCHSEIVPSQIVEVVLVHHLLAPRRLEALELLHVASIEGVECVDEPLLVCVPQGLQHRMHQLQTDISRQQSGCSSDAVDDSHLTAGSAWRTVGLNDKSHLR